MSRVGISSILEMMSPRPYARLERGTEPGEARDYNSVRHVDVKLVGSGRGEVDADESDKWSHDTAVLDQTIYNRDGHGGTDGESYSLSLAQYSRAYPDDLSVQVDQRTAAVALVDGGVCLNQIIKPTSLGVDGAPSSADNSQGNRRPSLQGQSVAQCHHPVSHLEIIGGPEGCGGQILCIYPDNSQVG